MQQRDCSLWSVADVQHFLASLGLEELQPTFLQHEVTGPVLLSLTEGDLEQALGIQKFGPRRRLALGISSLREQQREQQSKGRRSPRDRSPTSSFEAEVTPQQLENSHDTFSSVGPRSPSSFASPQAAAASSTAHSRGRHPEPHEEKPSVQSPSDEHGQHRAASILTVDSPVVLTAEQVIVHGASLSSREPSPALRPLPPPRRAYQERLQCSGGSMPIDAPVRLVSPSLQQNSPHLQVSSPMPAAMLGYTVQPSTSARALSPAPARALSPVPARALSPAPARTPRSTVNPSAASVVATSSVITQAVGATTPFQLSSPGNCLIRSSTPILACAKPPSPRPQMPQVHQQVHPLLRHPTPTTSRPATPPLSRTTTPPPSRFVSGSSISSLPTGAATPPRGRTITSRSLPGGAAGVPCDRWQASTTASTHTSPLLTSYGVIASASRVRATSSDRPLHEKVQSLSPGHVPQLDATSGGQHDTDLQQQSQQTSLKRTSAPVNPRNVLQQRLAQQLPNQLSAENASQSLPSLAHAVGSVTALDSCGSSPDSAGGIGVGWSRLSGSPVFGPGSGVPGADKEHEVAREEKGNTGASCGNDSGRPAEDLLSTHETPQEPYDRSPLADAKAAGQQRPVSPPPPRSWLGLGTPTSVFDAVSLGTPLDCQRNEADDEAITLGDGFDSASPSASAYAAATCAGMASYSSTSGIYVDEEIPATGPMRQRLREIFDHCNPRGDGRAQWKELLSECRRSAGLVDVFRKNFGAQGGQTAADVLGKMLQQLDSEIGGGGFFDCAEITWHEFLGAFVRQISKVPLSNTCPASMISCSQPSFLPTDDTNSRSQSPPLLPRQRGGSSFTPRDASSIDNSTSYSPIFGEGHLQHGAAVASSTPRQDERESSTSPPMTPSFAGATVRPSGSASEKPLSGPGQCGVLRATERAWPPAGPGVKSAENWPTPRKDRPQTPPPVPTKSKTSMAAANVAATTAMYREASPSKGFANDPNVVSWPLAAWGERQAAQHRHARSWVISRALATTGSTSRGPHDLSREAAQIRSLAREIETQIISVAATVGAGNGSPTLAEVPASDLLADRLRLARAYLQLLRSDVLEDLNVRAGQGKLGSREWSKVEAAMDACIGRLEEALATQSNNEIERGSVDRRAARRPRSTGNAPGSVLSQIRKHASRISTKRDTAGDEPELAAASTASARGAAAGLPSSGKRRPKG